MFNLIKFFLKRWFFISVFNFVQLFLIKLNFLIYMLLLKCQLFALQVFHLNVKLMYLLSNQFSENFPISWQASVFCDFLQFHIASSTAGNNHFRVVVDCVRNSIFVSGQIYPIAKHAKKMKEKYMNRGVDKSKFFFFRKCRQETRRGTWDLIIFSRDYEFANFLQNILKEFSVKD